MFPHSVGEGRGRVLAALAKLQWFPPLFARVTLGVLFASTGWGKVHNLGNVTAFFVDLGIPFPAFNAALVGWSELICGTLLLLGLLSRLATIPLMVTMTVALATALRSEIHNLPSLFGLVELTYLVLLVFVAIGGPGALSIDAWIADRLEHPHDEPHVPVARLSQHGV